MLFKLARATWCGEQQHSLLNLLAEIIQHMFADRAGAQNLIPQESLLTNLIKVVEREMVTLALGGDDHQQITLTETNVLHVHQRLTGLLEEAFIHLHEPKLVQLFTSGLAFNTDVTVNCENVSEFSIFDDVISVGALSDCHEEEAQEAEVAAFLAVQLGRQADGCGAAPEPSTKGDQIDDIV
ncbi:unnamed protein product [Mesocestoides corti]|uniref:CRM1_C domain-containing protein n=1 Tax=Mesocestoides corti TaxID=53468 RepID=A0A0R3UNW2_MESCO|nr:unnamed protein product [Mesocestoides corti]